MDAIARPELFCRDVPTAAVQVEVAAILKGAEPNLATMKHDEAEYNRAILLQAEATARLSVLGNSDPIIHEIAMTMQDMLIKLFQFAADNGFRMDRPADPSLN